MSSASSQQAGLGRWLAATRPGFLLVTWVAVALGTAQAIACTGTGDAAAAVASLLLAAMAHAAANLYNDYGDAVGGSDAINTGRLPPFSGGSRVIQEGPFSAAQVRQVAQGLALLVVGGGLVLAARSGPGLLAVGLAGMTLGWAYSSPRVALMSHGLGEVAVALAWWLVVLGASHVQAHAFSAMAALSGVSLALLVLAILWAAEFPDAAADAAVGKRTLVVRWGPQVSAIAHAGLVSAAHVWVLPWWWVGWLPDPAWWALGSAPLSAGAAFGLWRHARRPERLRPVMRLNILAAVLHGSLFTAAWVAVALQR